MDEQSLLHGVLFYTTAYVNCLLCIVAIITGRWIFLLLMVLTIGLTAYMMYMTTYNSDHLKSVGKWAENMFSKMLIYVKKVKTI